MQPRRRDPKRPDDGATMALPGAVIVAADFEAAAPARADRATFDTS